MEITKTTGWINFWDKIRDNLRDTHSVSESEALELTEPYQNTGNELFLYDSPSALADRLVIHHKPSARC